MAASGEDVRAALRKIDGVFDVPHWLDILDAAPSVTFKTVLVDLPRHEGEALLAAARARQRVLESALQSKIEMDTSDNPTCEGEFLFTEGTVLEYLSYFESMGGQLDSSDFQEHTDAEQCLFPASHTLAVAEKFLEFLPSSEVHENILVVARKLQSAMQELQGSQASSDASDICSFFVRLSSRSPKDAAGVNELAFLNEALQQRAGQKTLDGRFGLFCDLFLRGMRVESGVDAVHLLIASDRVTSDLLQALEAADQYGTPYDLSVAVRAWDSGVREDGEFRGFMSTDGQLVAISQYNQYFLQPELGEHREAIIQHLVKFTEEHLRPRLLGSCFLPCVLDLVILQRGGLHHAFDPHGEIRVVELNPANERTSTALLDKDEVLTWVKREDALLQFRLVEKSEVQNSRFLQERINEAHWRWKAREMFRDAL